MRSQDSPMRSLSVRPAGAHRPHLPAGLVVPAVAVSALALIPLAYVILVLVQTGLATFIELTVRPRVFELLANTIALLVLAIPASVAIGVGAAWLVERTDLPGRRAWAVLLAAPLVVPAFVTSYGWITVIPSMSGLGAGVLIATLSYYPLIYLPVVATLRRLDPALEEVAASLGRSPRRVFAGIVLPQLRLPILGGGLLVGLHLLAEYGAFAMLRFDTFTTAIIAQYRSTFNGPAAASLASVLVLCCLGLLLFENVARGDGRVARIGSGAPRPHRRKRLGRSVLPAAAFVAIVVTMAVGVPMLSIARWLGIGGIGAWTQDHLVQALVQTTTLAAAGAILAVAFALPLAILVVRYASQASRTLEATNYVTSALPGIVVALALATITIRLAPPLYQTVVVLLLAYVLLFLPRALINLRSGIAQVPVGLEEVAQSLGDRPAVAFARVTARLAAPAALAGAALVFLGIVNELTATLLLSPTGTRTLTTQFWTHVNDLDYAAAAPYAFLMVVLSIPMVSVLFRASQGSIARG
jgi:iron(III) transport system permease protein